MPPTSILRDVANAASSLRPGNYRLDRTRSAFYLPNTRNFPMNTEVDMTLTFVNEPTGGGGGGGGPTQGPAPIGQTGGGGGGGGGFGGGLFSGSVGSVTPSPDAVTLREHASFVQLPDHTTFKPRHDDPRAGYGGATFVDYSQPIGETDPVPLHPSPSPPEEGSERGDQRAGQADSVLGGFGRAGGREEGADRRRAVVEPGVRSRGLPQRVQGRGAAGRRRPDGHPLQHDQLGPSLDARLELGRFGHRIRAPARSSRPRSRSDRCAIARTT